MDGATGMNNGIRLAANVGIRDGAALKARLLPLLESPEPIIIDVTDVEHVDTAAMQLLFAFARDRRAAGLAVTWQGDSSAWRSGVATLASAAGAPAALTNI